jgi:hypothetical protein
MIKIVKNNVALNLLNKINKFKRINGHYPHYLEISTEDLAELREEMSLPFDTDLTEFLGIKLKVLYEETC